MKKLLTRTILLVFLLVLATAAVAATEYRVFLKNGSWVRAQAKPTVENGRARIRLLPGQLTILPEEQIDWAASERWNRDELSSAQPAESDNVVRNASVKPQLDGPVTITKERPKGSGTARVVTPAAPAPAPAAAERPQPAPLEDPDAALRTRISEIDKQLQDLREQKKGFERQAEGSLRVEDSTRLRKQAADLGVRIQTLRGQQNGLILKLSNRKP